MRFIRLCLVLGGLFNVSMGFIFLNGRLLQAFFSWAESMELRLFHAPVSLSFPHDPVQQLLIHGFGAGVLILGATLIYSAKEPRRFLPFILLDGLGRLLFGLIMLYHVVSFSLMRTIFLFGIVELLFALIYISASWILWKTAAPQEQSQVKEVS